MTLTIDLESSELAGQSGDAGSAITNVRKFHNVVLVRDQQTIVVGGLIRDSKVSGETRVPYLGRIPLLGNLFKYRSAKRQKTNLMVFIRPTVLTDRPAGVARHQRQVQGDPRSTAGAGQVGAGAADAALRHRAAAAAGAWVGTRHGGAGRRRATNLPGTVNASAQELAVPGKTLPFAFARRHGIVLRELREGVAHCAVRSNATPSAVAETRRLLRIPLSLERVADEEFELLLQAAYEGGAGSLAAAGGGLEENADLANLALELPEQADLLDSDDDAPIIRLINAVFSQAIRENASDIHIEPFENRLVVRFRVDGVLREVLQTKRAVAPLVVSRVKVMSRLDIAEKRLPQDGRISLRIAGRAVDVRVSTIPSGHGERVVLRLLDKQAGRLELTSLGMDPRTRERVDELIHKPHGIILVTGPTGSGKTTTLYAGWNGSTTTAATS